MRIKDFNLGKLFNNNRFLMVFSLIMAVLIWLFVSVEKSTDITRTLTNVPVQVDYSRLQENFGLVPYGNSTYTVDIKVSGKRYNVDNEQELLEELVVSANTGKVNSVGTYSLPVTVESSNDRAAYTIDSWSLQSVDVYFDYPKEKEFAVTADIQTADALVEEGYVAGELVFGESTSVRVSGPESEVSKITAVVARASVDVPLTENTALDATLVAETRDGSTPNYISFNRASNVAHITVPVYKKATLPATVSFSGIPSAYLDQLPFTVTVEPASAEFGVTESRLDGIDSFEIAKIPFSSLTAGTNVIEIKASELTGGIVVDGTEKFTVTVVAEGMKAVTLAAPASLNFPNVPDGMSAKTESIHFEEITLVGPAEKVDALTTDSIVLDADLSTVPEGTTGTVAVPVTVTGDDYWSYGEYIASVQLQ
ncbi:MAG: hypothetical protein IK080_01450 [Clostridia bacterium]|nr:hypothetical protein [Clostridia bacterium]